MRLKSKSIATVVMATVVLHSSPAFASSNAKCFPNGQKLLACTYLFYNAKVAAHRFGSDVLSLLTKGGTRLSCMKEMFAENPILWDSMKVTQAHRYPTEENQLKIYNTEEGMMPVCKKSLGFCWGHATMRFHMTRLAFYDAKGAFEALPKHAEGSKKWLKFYHQKIVDIMDGKPTIIPGFKNLSEFSGHPELQDFFKSEAAIEWAQHMAKLRNMGMFLSKKDFTPAESKAFVKSVEDRLALGYNPKIIFDENSHKLVEGTEKSLHVVLAVAVHKLQNNKTAIIVWDDKHAYPDALELLVVNHDSGLGNFIPWRFEADGSGLDMGGGTVNQYRIAPENDEQAMKIALNLADFCKKNPAVCESLGANEQVAVPKPKLDQPGRSWNTLKYLED